MVHKKIASLETIEAETSNRDSSSETRYGGPRNSGTMITNRANANAEYMRTERRIASALRDNVRRSGESSINLNGSLVATSHRCGRRPGTLVKLQSHDSSPYLEGVGIGVGINH